MIIEGISINPRYAAAISYYHHHDDNNNDNDDNNYNNNNTNYTTPLLLMYFKIFSQDYGRPYLENQILPLLKILLSEGTLHFMKIALSIRLSWLRKPLKYIRDDDEAFIWALQATWNKQHQFLYYIDKKVITEINFEVFYFTKQL